MKSKAKTVVAALVALTIAESQASLITLEITGHITTVDPLLASHYSPNTPIVVTFSYLTDQLSTPTDSGSDYASSVFVTSSGNHLSGSGILSIKNNVPYDEASFAYLPMSGLPIASFETPTIYVNFVDLDSAIFNDSALPDPFPTLQQWDNFSSAFISYEDAGANMSRRVHFAIDQMTVVPEPEYALFLVSGVAFIFCRRAHRTRGRCVSPAHLN